ncbi:hypothetical protein HPT25_21015 [Bacillus sp. BRMEA1]|uniref:hypothetical protein n=1 Tax=Neobacillus endophyticus TaxID=2738405 RepID=UPI001566F63A|nr:hypothetical protein [Neobacillus endophyticus]NRD79820.1 hypothetical protein [Neobacillus endophyticus]
MTNFNCTDGIDITVNVKGSSHSRIHFQLTTECTSEQGLTTITYTITHFLDSTVSLIYLNVDDQIFPFDTGINPGSIGKVQFTRSGFYVPALGSVFIETSTQGYEFGSLCTAVLKGPCHPPV